MSSPHGSELMLLVDITFSSASFPDLSSESFWSSSAFLLPVSCSRVVLFPLPFSRSLPLARFMSRTTYTYGSPKTRGEVVARRWELMGRRRHSRSIPFDPGRPCPRRSAHRAARLPSLFPLSTPSSYLPLCLSHNISLSSLFLSFPFARNRGVKNFHGGQ